MLPLPCLSESQIPSIQAAIQSQKQEQLHSRPSLQQGTSNQRWKELEEESSQRLSKKVNRRLASSKRNCIKKHANQLFDIELQNQELELMKNNIHKFGVAETKVHNLTQTMISKDELNSLALGLKFIPVPRKNPEFIANANKEFIKTIRWKWIFKDKESTLPLYWIPSTRYPNPLFNKPEIERCLKTLEKNILISNAPATRNISKQHIPNLKRLLNKPDILVITADKNLGYAIVNINWYREKCLEHLESSSYINVTTKFNGNDSGITFTKQLYDELCNLISQFKICLTDEEIKWILQIQEWKAMQFYITAKVHKNPTKGRPITPSMTWITHSLSQWIANQLNPLVIKLNWVLKDSNELIKTLYKLNSSQTLSTLNHLEIYSADVEALYPNINIDLGLKLMSDFINEIDWEYPIKRKFLLDAMNFVLTKGFIKFDNQIYQQIDGAAMGSPMIPPYANITVYMLERSIVEIYTDKQFLILYKRFIDDVLIITQNDPHLLKAFQNDLNNLHPRIKLTWTNKSAICNFLDVNLWISHKNFIHSNVFQKTLNTYAYLPYHSYHTTAQKKGFIKAEALRYSRLCTRKRDYHKMLQLLIIRLQRRGYPLAFIENAIQNVTWNERIEHLFTKQKDKNRIPLLYKIMYSETHTHQALRHSLDEFTYNMHKITDLPNTLTENITICYKLPKKLHSLVLKARKNKGF